MTRSAAGTESKEQRFLRSALTEDSPFQTTAQAAAWVRSRGAANRFLVERTPFSALTEWSFESDTGDLVHRSGKFFRVHGVRVRTNAGRVREWDQPIIDQPEIGILGIIAREFDGKLYVLMQAKMEPGNVAGVQLTPTVQATRSNYTQVHQGSRPRYVEYFLEPERAQVLVDQLQYEQGSAFLRKRNRNVVALVADEIPVGEEYSWFTLGQIKRLLAIPNLVSMDARTVLSCIPLVERALGGAAEAAALLQDGHRPPPFGASVIASASEAGRSLLSDDAVLGWLAQLKCMYQVEPQRIGLREVLGWSHRDQDIVADGGGYFGVVAVSVEAGNREVSQWNQPLVRSVERGLVAFLVKEINGVLHFLVQGTVEPGNPDVVAVGATVHCVMGADRLSDPVAWPRFADTVLGAPAESIRYSCVQSEEGGRFYHVENEYRVVELKPDGDLSAPESYLWLTLRQLNEMLRYGLVNVEARSLLACLPLT